MPLPPTIREGVTHADHHRELGDAVDALAGQIATMSTRVAALESERAAYVWWLGALTLAVLCLLALVLVT